MRWKRPYTAGPAPLTSARNAPCASSSAATGDARKVVQRQGGEVAWSADRAERHAEVPEAFLVPRLAAALVERCVDVGRRSLDRALREHEHDREVLRQVERLEPGAVAGPELRPVAQEERDVRAGPRCELVQLGRGSLAGS